jgi:SAM-dependent methyltransferase
VDSLTTYEGTLPRDGEPGLVKRAARGIVPPRLRPRLFGAVRALRYRGSDVHCPLCSGDFARFIPHRGIAPGRCPRCGSLERHRLLVGYLADRPELFGRQVSVLHIAPEYGLQRMLRAMPNVTYRSADLDSPLADDAVDIHEMPYGDASFDVLICSHVLEHVRDDRVSLGEIRRVLAPGGTAVIMSPIDEKLEETHEDASIVEPAERHRVYGQSDHLRRYGRDFADRVAATGFRVEVISPIDLATPERIRREGLRREGAALFCDDDVFICTPVPVALPEAPRAPKEDSQEFVNGPQKTSGMSALLVQSPDNR